MKRCVRAGRNALVLTLASVALVVMLVPSARAVTVERVVSPGGIEAWFVKDSTVPLLAIEFSFRGGAVHDPKGKAGLANLTAALLDEGAGDMDSQAFQGRLQNLSITSGTFTTPTATVELQIGEDTHKTAAMGDGPVDAIYKALGELAGSKAVVLRYQVNAITSGMDAQGEVTVTLEDDGIRVIGQGAHTDILVASARAYVHAPLGGQEGA